jgi:thiol-disulfide isomerase/thioredoxin
MKRIFYALMFSLSLNVASSQSLKGLKIGDTLPPVMVTYLDGKETRQAELSTFYKSKFLVLDFWATWCGACLRSMPEADSIINKFAGKIKFLPITYEDRKTVQQFASKNKMLNKHKFQLVVEDSLMMGGYFKFTVLPHQVWIDTNGAVRAVTYPDQLTYRNLLSFIGNDKFSVEEKIDDVEFDASRPLNADSGSILYRSLLMPYKSGILNQMGTYSPAFNERFTIDRFHAINKDLLSIYYAAYSQNHGSINFNRIELDVKDSLALNPFFENDGNPSRNQIRKNCFCYELILPIKVTGKQLYSYIMEDLNRFSKFYGSIEKRQKKCWVMVNQDKAKNPSIRAGEPKLQWTRGFINKMENEPISLLTAYLNWNMEYPVINETGYQGLLNVELDIIANATKGGWVYFDVDKVRKSLNRYGFDIIAAERNVDVLVIIEK